MKSPASTKQVNEKNTKQEILSAYQELAVKMEESPVSGETLQKLGKSTSAFETSLETTAQELKDNLDSAVASAISQLSEANKAIELLKEAHESQKRILSGEKEQIQKDNARRLEEQAYEFAKTKKRQEEELGVLRQKVEAELSQRKDLLKAQEDELVDLQNQVKTFDARLQKAVGDAVTTVTKNLTNQFDHEKALLTQKAEAKQELLGQQVASLDEVIASQKQEIVRLNVRASEMSTQLTRIAERAVTKASPEASTSSSRPSVA